jgi:hypothetical protein
MTMRPATVGLGALLALAAGTELMIDLGRTSIRLPVVGGAEAMKRAMRQ